jgi:hypothetical protein
MGLEAAVCKVAAGINAPDITVAVVASAAVGGWVLGLSYSFLHASASLLFKLL